MGDVAGKICQVLNSQPLTTSRTGSRYSYIVILENYNWESLIVYWRLCFWVTGIVIDKLSIMFQASQCIMHAPVNQSILPSLSIYLPFFLSYLFFLIVSVTVVATSFPWDLTIPERSSSTQIIKCITSVLFYDLCTVERAKEKCLDRSEV